MILQETTVDGNVYPSRHSLCAVEQKRIPIFKMEDPWPGICVGLSDDH
jgi:hypothetical protein